MSLPFALKVLTALTMLPQQSTATGGATDTTRTPAVVAQFLATVGSQPPMQSYMAAAQAAVWRYYPEGEGPKQELVAYLSHTRHRLGVGIAALALVPYHDPATIGPMLDRAMQDSLHPGTRWILMNTVPLVLCMGQAFTGGWSGALDTYGRDRATLWRGYADSAIKYGLGRSQARRLRGVAEMLSKQDSITSDQIMGFIDMSGPLVGTFDLRDGDLLMPMVGGHQMFVSGVFLGLEIASNHIFAPSGVGLGRLSGSDIPGGVAAARAWWSTYLRDYPDGDRRPAVIAGFRDRGYAIDTNLKSPVSTRELLRALQATDGITRYNACRLLNEVYDVHADLEAVFPSAAYALNPMDPTARASENEIHLCNYWTQRLSGTDCPSDLKRPT